MRSRKEGDTRTGSSRPAGLPGGRSDDRGLQEAFHRWACDHAARYPEIGIIDYEPERHPEQKTDTFKTAPVGDLESIPAGKLSEKLCGAYLRTLGAGAASTAAAVERGLGDEVRDTLSAGRSIAILANHADRLHDIGMVCGAVAIALGSADGIRKNGTLLNKVMTRESFRSTPIADLFRFFGNVYWVIPDTGSATRWGVRSGDSSYINAGAIRALVSDMRHGVALTFAPSGSAMRRTLSDDGTVRSLVIPPVSAGTSNLISRFDAYIAVATWGDEVRFGPLIRTSPRLGEAGGPRRSRLAGIVADAMETLASMTSELSGLPTRVESAEEMPSPG